jgi:oxysterol-binding protein-related protein 3/6/7
VRYRECFANETLVWQFKPIKKSINWAIWRKTDNPIPKPTPLEPGKTRPKRRQRRNTLDGDVSTTEERKFNLKEKLVSVGMEEVVPGGRCEGGQIQKGTYNVIKGGMYALVFGISIIEKMLIGR